MALSLPIALVVAALASDGSAALDQVEQAAPNFPASGVEIVEKLGDSVPLDVPLRDYTGKDTTFGALIDGDIPTILTFNYSNCPNLCSLQLNGLVSVLPELAWRVGRQFRIVTIVLDPTEELDRVRETRDRYVSRLPAGSIPEGWVFATTRKIGDGTPIKTIADAVGFHTMYIPSRAEWAHPAALIFLSNHGKVTRYVNGVDYDKDVMTQSIVRAGTDEVSEAAGFLMRCFHWDPTENDYSKMGTSIMRYAAAGFLLLVLVLYGVWHLVRRRRARSFGDRP